MLNNLKRILDHDGERTLDLKGIKSYKAYMNDEISTYPEKEALIRFVFTHHLLWDSSFEAEQMAFHQAAYLLDESELAATDYLKMVYVQNSIEHFFFLSPTKCRDVLGKERADELFRLEDEGGLLFTDDLRVTFNSEFDAYKELAGKYLAEYGFENLAYTFEDFLDTDLLIEGYTVLFHNKESWAATLAYLQALLPEIPDGIKEWECLSLVHDSMHELLLGMDHSHALKLRLLKNYRLLDTSYIVGMTEKVNRKRQELQARAPGTFKHIKR